MVINTIENYESFIKLREAWNDLLESSAESENVFLRHEWFDVWWQAFGANKEMFILLCFNEDRILGIAPLMIFRDYYKGIPYTRLGFIENPNAPSVDFIIKKGEENRVIRSFLDYLVLSSTNVWHVSVLNKIPNVSDTIGACEEFFSQNKIKYLLRKGQSSPYIPMNSDWDTFLKSTSVRFRKQLRNKINKINSAGQMGCEVWHDVRVDGKHLIDAISVSSRSWKHREGTSMNSTPERRKFFELLSGVASRNGWLRIWLLNLDGKPIAVEYHLEYKRRTNAMRGDFDEAYDNLSPGSILEAHIIEHCFNKGLLEYNFCGLDYRYKMRWTSHLYKQSNILVYNATPYSMFLYMLQKNLPLFKQKWIRLFSRPSNTRSSGIHPPTMKHQSLTINQQRETSNQQIATGIQQLSTRSQETSNRKPV